MKFPEILRTLMQARNETPTLINKATGIPISTISEWTANRIPRFTPDILKLANHFEVSLEYLITGKPRDQIKHNSTLTRQIEVDDEILIHVRVIKKHVQT